MFGLPAFTVIAIFGVSAIWVIYTVVFFTRTRHWVNEDAGEDPTSALAGGTGAKVPHRSHTTGAGTSDTADTTSSSSNTSAPKNEKGGAV